ncbi:DUF1376 domain-containing protein [Pseudomonas sp. DTU_2021_1001937_2_SI_NGA_ILE_001]|uniref:DUF1376 domain-containing protein n=1 Tax=Pseudomonas sp. DTU_2021_1001937_2_SI_NGA_ILE_001 TaxID=3077589 RepID=UPI0028FC0C09|nr:DUF1376 domain-containing protein [Pseudomonas sp. DTU_2021_1001937_2_SI_NGA_ILE_001]WNW10109.1 DUF1376 domain-containing protein [Pseudomonas sp. DTU_2021_1001937_2_SI_NGA_ILE_001]
MAALPYIQLYVADYLADTMHLTTEEHGAYLLLIFNYWQTGKPIPKNRLARIARVSNDRWVSVEASLNEFFNDNGEEWVHKRIERDLDAVHATQAQRIAAGKASAEAKKNRKRTAPQREDNARSTTVEGSLQQNSTNKDTDTDTEEHTHNACAHVEPAPDDQAARPRFAMTDAWEPDSKSFTAVLNRNGMANQTFSADQLLEFRSYWISRPDDLKTQAQWEHALAQRLKSQHVKNQARGPSHDSSGRTAPSRTRNAHDILTDPTW